MSLVIDSSITLAWFFEDAWSAAADTVLRQVAESGAVADTDRQAWGATLILAERCQLTLYDAAYLELAQRIGSPLASLDQPLRAAAQAVGVTLTGN